MNTKEWLQEREVNAIRFAEERTGADKAGWLEDAMYFRSAIAACDEVDVLRSSLRGLYDEVASRFGCDDDMGADLRKVMNGAKAALTPNVQGVATAEGGSPPAQS